MKFPYTSIIYFVVNYLYYCTMPISIFKPFIYSCVFCKELQLVSSGVISPSGQKGSLEDILLGMVPFLSSLAPNPRAREKELCGFPY